MKCCPLFVRGALTVRPTIGAWIGATVISQILETWHLGFIFSFALTNAAVSVVVFASIVIVVVR